MYYIWCAGAHHYPTIRDVDIQVAPPPCQKTKVEYYLIMNVIKIIQLKKVLLLLEFSIFIMNKFILPDIQVNVPI
jgi:hypothetical protein